MQLVDQQQQQERIVLPYANESDRYKLGTEDLDLGNDKNSYFKRQFIHLYRRRVGLLKGTITRNARKILGRNINITELDYRSTHANKEVLIAGAIYKKMKWRQSVLFEFSEDNNLHVKMTRKYGENLTDDADTLEIEDYKQMFKLTGEIDKHKFVTGEVVGLIGTQDTIADIFNVRIVVCPEVPEQIPWPLIEKDCYIAFVSGISLSSKFAKNAQTFEALRLFKEWLTGEEVPGEEEEQHINWNVSRLVIAGDFARLHEMQKEIEYQKVGAIGVHYESDMDCFAQFDIVLEGLLKCIPVDLMPGANDPTSYMIPQQPMPLRVFKSAQMFKHSLNTVTNPYRFSVAGLQLLGTSGQNLNDLRRLTHSEGTLELMERTLRRGYLFPTVPDTLCGFPFHNRDPLILDRLPHVYFVGNQPSFETKMLNLGDGEEAKKCLLISIPKFCETRSVLLLNMRTLQLDEYTFAVPSDMGVSQMNVNADESMEVGRAGEEEDQEDEEEMERDYLD